MSRALDVLRNYRRIAREVKKLVRKVDPKAEVYVFGSVVRGDYTAASDIDILVVTERIKRKYDMMVRVYSSLDAPVELHIASPELYERWYKRFIGEDEIERV